MADTRQTQEGLEYAGLPQPDAVETQAGLEVVQEPPPSAALRETQAALEQVAFPLNAVWQTQECLEVLFVNVSPLVRNHSFVGGSIGTGHRRNASFSQ